MVMGFNIMFAAMGYTITNVAEWGYKNYVGYYERTAAQKLAESAANMACTQIDMSPNWRAGYSNVSCMGGRYSATVTDADSGRIRLCVTATWDSVTYTDTLLMGLRQFSEYAYFSNVEGSINWASGDTVWGPFHTQATMKINGHPVFEGYTTAKNGINNATGSSSAIFLGGYKGGVNIPLPSTNSSVVKLAKSAGAYFLSKELYIQFNGNGTVTWRLNSWAGTPTTVPLATLAPNGVLADSNGNLHLKGVLSGQITVSAVQGATNGTGNVYFDSSIVYKNNPMNNVASTDLLGVVCDNNAIVSDNTNNNDPTKGVTLEASILCRTGGLTAQNYDSRPIAGTLALLGGVQQYQRGAVGTLDGYGNVNHGFNKSYHYDDRLRIISPPSYPSTNSYKVLSWYESLVSSNWFWKNL
jgi:hypothetical protein